MVSADCKEFLKEFINKYKSSIDSRDWDEVYSYLQSAVDKGDVKGSYISAFTSILERSGNGDVMSKLIFIPDYFKMGHDDIAKVDIPIGIREIGDNAFAYCNKLEQVNVNNSTITIGSGAFKSCSNLKDIKLPDSIRYINSEAFSDCDSLTSVTIPKQVRSVGRRAFYGCNNLTKVIVKSRYVEFALDAFKECPNLKEIIIPDSSTIDGLSSVQDIVKRV